jgi:hypothetical protein
LVLRGTEKLLMAAAVADVDLDGIGELTGIERIARGPGWFQIDSCWIELAEVQRLADAALGTPAARVFALPGTRGGTSLVAYLAGGSIRTPEQAHAACLSLLPRRYTAMTPGRYVICERAPDDPADLTGWRAQPVLADGDGRGQDKSETTAARP